MMMTKAGMAVWDEVQGDCDAQRLKRALDSSGEKSMTLDGWTPLHYACENRSISDATRAQAIQTLVQYGVDVNAVDEHGWTALHMLSKNKYVAEQDSSLNELLAGGANAGVQTTDSKRTALHFLCENEGVTPSALTRLLKARIDVNAADQDGNTALHYLTENTSITTELLTPLLEAKADLNTQNQFQSTPFHNLCQNSLLTSAFVRLFHQHRANPNTQNNIGNTPFHFACENYSLTVDIIQEFISSKLVNLTITNSLGKTAPELIPAHKQDCVAFAQKYAAPSMGSNISLATAKVSTVAGGEDASDLPSPLTKHLTSWNASLPPFDMAFYNAICCEPAFASTYEEVQEISLQLCEAPNNSTLFHSWEQCLTKWRTSLLVAYTALVQPDLWSNYAEKYGRSVPSDVSKVRGKVVEVWQRFPDPAQRRERLDALTGLFSA
ncbi:hypothetical protein Poli38472_006053 [Pythium oligandrum]|uniref:Ankyrin repeat protein n=1 Tax=Pythium oligandrum TaxID=41045 RepID=A0A8K1CTW1_PYTOL|nr:hypothetical protein Poli38472_006053 [Pythium oligandrum]|eukprot:TMW68585.1 hypothetical protein Poli38472_006053 [Pythium oligandrum]